MANGAELVNVADTINSLEKAVEGLTLNYTVYPEGIRHEGWRIYVDIDGLMGNRLMSCEFNLNTKAGPILGVLEALDKHFGGDSE